MTMMIPLPSLFIVVVVSFLFLSFSPTTTMVMAEIRPYHGYLEPLPFLVHFTAGYIQAPGQVDISKLSLTALSDGLIPSMVDIVLFREPDECARHNHKPCDWTTLGVGQRAKGGGVAWCSMDGRLLVQPRITSTAYTQITSIPIPATGPLRIELSDYVSTSAASSRTNNHDSNHQNTTATPTALFSVPPKSQQNQKRQSHRTTTTDASGKYILLFANCNLEGRVLMVDGTYTFSSYHDGYLPGDMYGEYLYFKIVFLGYTILSIWYGYRMKQYEASRTSIQIYIMMTIFLGWLESLFLFCDYLFWNHYGTRNVFFLYVSIGLGVLKHTMARCLLVMVSLGWGVLCHSIARTLYWRLVVLCSLYAIIAMTATIVSVIAMTHIQTLTTHTEMELMGLDAILGLILLALNVIFLIWIFAALRRTMTQLAGNHGNSNNSIDDDDDGAAAADMTTMPSQEQQQQHDRPPNVKLQRYHQVTKLLCFFSAYALLWIVLLRTELLYQFLPTSEAWIITKLMELDYLIFMTGIAILWRPTSNSRAYAYYQDIHMMNDDDDDLSNALELTEDIPSDTMNQPQNGTNEDSDENQHHHQSMDSSSLPINTSVLT